MQADFTQVHQQQPIGNSCKFCDKVCGFTAGLRSYMRVYELLSQPKTALLLVTCGRACKGEAGPKIHMCSHGCFLWDWDGSHTHTQNPLNNNLGLKLFENNQKINT